MKNYTTKLASLLSLLLVVSITLTSNSVNAQKKKNKKSKTEQTAKPVPKKDKKKTIADLTKSSKEIDGLFKIYQDTLTGSVNMLITKEQLDKEYIHFSQVANGATDFGVFRGAYGGSTVFKISKYFNKIEFTKQNTSFYFDPESALSKSADANNTEGVMASLKVEASDDKKGLYLIKADDLFLKETFTQIKPSKRPGTPPTAFSLGNLDKNKTKINAIRNYPENTDLAIEYVYSKSSTLNGGSNAISDGRNVSIKIFHSLIEMPDNDYEPRFDDPRVGYFLTQVDDKTSTETANYRDLVHRWNLIKKNPEAELSEPVEPITWWMENSTPVEWRETIKEGVLRWNIAFEKAGFKNAMVVKMQPDDADWDAGDIRYNVLRWTSSPNPPFGGYGPSFVNPRTGEIMGADIMLEYVHFTNRLTIDKMYNEASDNIAYNSYNNEKYNCIAGELMQESSFFGKTVISAFGDSKLELDKMLYDNMMRLIMHEVGHTLGLNHNMKGSQLFSPEELATPELIEGKALSTSVMEYPSINVTVDRSKQGIYYDNSVGPYDKWAIEFGYKPFKSDQERESLLSKSTQPELVFGNDADDMRSTGKGIDPRVNIYDHSNDPITFALDRITLSKNTLKTIKNTFTEDGKSYQELKNAYLILTNQIGGSGTIISKYIGGVYVDRAMVGQEGATQPYTPVSLEDQKRAMKGLEDHIFAPNAFDAPNELYNFIASQRRGFGFFGGPEDPKIHGRILNFQKRVLAQLLHRNTLQRISDSELYGNEYSLTSFMTDLNKSIFSTDISGNVNSFRQNLQVEYTNMLINMLTGKSSSSYTHTAKSMALYNLKSIRTMSSNSGNISSKAHKQHLRILIDNALKEIK
ncbi:zinc-dependent metalloprotease [Urechidicola vernalis]|uniref:Zinc-dependent metalloprotease n=1 Tax=Urechidicola vernalis TaxID=3075600 RepID=A0ABU2Y0W1_9FLAO|nr:zinc-dependent metalloprotease [Urechidicola sp. P050]MDT0551637.1 zinc-dependent metalloprotease [Urechidicola sp. P050]